MEESNSKEDLLTSFMHYVTSDDKEELKNCLSGDFDCQDDDLLELLSSYMCFKLLGKMILRSYLWSWRINR